MLGRLTVLGTRTGVAFPMGQTRYPGRPMRTMKMAARCFQPTKYKGRPVFWSVGGQAGDEVGAAGESGTVVSAHGRNEASSPGPPGNGGRWRRAFHAVACPTLSGTRRFCDHHFRSASIR